MTTKPQQPGPREKDTGLSEPTGKHAVQARELREKLESWNNINDDDVRHKYDELLAEALAACALEAAQGEFAWAIDALKDMGHLNVALDLLARHSVREQVAQQRGSSNGGHHDGRVKR